MTRSPHQARVFISALLLVLQVLGLGHVALARHELSQSGALVDVEPLLVDTHEETQSHFCGDEVAIHADAPGDCLVVATWTSPQLLSPVAVVLPRSLTSSTAAPARARFVAPPLEVLARAPKASPPQG